MGNKVCRTDLLAFSDLYYNTYYATCKKAMRAQAPNKLYLGSRIHVHQNIRLLEICGKHADVVSINCYDMTPNIINLPANMNKPVIIGEYHFGTITERGVWGGGLCTATDMNHAAELFKNYTRAAIKNPRIIGAHYFQISDQAITGRGDGENYRIGFIDVTDTPYPDMVDTAREVAANMYEMRANLKSGK